MNKLLKPIVLGAGFAALMVLGDATNVSYQLAFVQEASAVVVRRAVVAPVATAVVVGSVVASSSANAAAAANANSAAAANANAAAANANTAAANANTAATAPKQPAAPGSAPPVGTMVTSLPPGCSGTKLNGVDYQRCGSTYYEAKMMGNNLVFVVAQP